MIIHAVAQKRKILLGSFLLSAASVSFFRVVPPPPDDGVDDLRRDLYHSDDVRDVAQAPPDFRCQRLSAGYPPLVDEPLPAARLSMVSILFSFTFNCFALEIESFFGIL